MDLKSFQRRVLGDLQQYLEALASERDKRRRLLLHDDPDVVEVAKERPFPRVAWPGHRKTYKDAVTGDGEPVPDVTIKVPTGGGKTLIACHAITEIQRKYIKNLHGLVVWIVPTTQIYRQTLSALQDRQHPYRLAVVNAFGGDSDKVNVTEREKHLVPGDLKSMLTILLLMLPAANQPSNSERRMYRDVGAFAEFFPPDEAPQAHHRLAERVSNLDIRPAENGERTIRTSLANFLRLNRPLIIVDEGHRAYSKRARETILGFNPTFVLQLSATPKDAANVLTEATGQDLDREEMIKIPIHVTPAPADADWKTTVLRAHQERNRLEQEADVFRQNSGRYIRPICLIQVERTGQDQLKSGHIHAEHVREYLLADCKIPEDQVAIKSSERDDIEKENLLEEDCPVRYIITKRALQEGWDCAFAYVLAVLTNPSSKESLTQLVGRVLRQPHASRTDNPSLDKCRIFSHQSQATPLLRKIKSELEKEGLGDLRGRVVSDQHTSGKAPTETPKIRKRLKNYDGRLFLPLFSARRRGEWGPIDFEADLLAHADWDQVYGLGEKIGSEINIQHANRSSDYLKYLPETQPEEFESGVTYCEEADPVLLTRELTIHTANAWKAWGLANDILDRVCSRHGEAVLAQNYVHIIETSRKIVEDMVDRLCERVFRSKLESGDISFRLLEHPVGNAIGRIRPVPVGNRLHFDGEFPKKSLFGFYDRLDFNNFEADVAICLDKQAKLLWWHRMATGAGYRIQGWKRHRIHPDFLASRKPTEQEAQTEIYVIETKGQHLVNEDTAYKQAIFDLCNKHTPVSKSWHDLGLGFKEHVFSFKVVYEHEWKNVLAGLFT